MDKHQKKGVLLRPSSQLLSNSFVLQNLVEILFSPGLAQVSPILPTSGQVSPTVKTDFAMALQHCTRAEGWQQRNVKMQHDRRESDKSLPESTDSLSISGKVLDQLFPLTNW